MSRVGYRWDFQRRRHGWSSGSGACRPKQMGSDVENYVCGMPKVLTIVQSAAKRPDIRCIAMRIVRRHLQVYGLTLPVPNFMSVSDPESSPCRTYDKPKVLMDVPLSGQKSVRMVQYRQDPNLVVV
jgi:hypothetical protein